MGDGDRLGGTRDGAALRGLAGGGRASGLLRGGHPCAAPGRPLWEVAYIPSLSVISLGLASLTIGLVRPWGEVFPAWLPWIGGRRVPLAFAVTAATAGAVLVAAFIVRAAVAGEPSRPLPPGCSPPGWDVLRFYVPMVLWPPLLLAVTWHHYRRRRTHRTALPPETA